MVTKKHHRQISRQWQRITTQLKIFSLLELVHHVVGHHHIDQVEETLELPRRPDTIPIGSFAHGEIEEVEPQKHEAMFHKA